MKNVLNFKYLMFAAVMAVFALTACDGKNEGKLSTDLVTSPKSASETSEKQAVIKFDKEEHNFGTLLQGEVVTYSFHFTNTGNMPLIISDVSSSCGCTVGDFPREPIAPGKDGAGGDKRSYPMCEVKGGGREEIPRPQARGQGWRAGGATPRLRPGAVAGRTNSMSKQPWLRGCRRA